MNRLLLLGSGLIFSRVNTVTVVGACETVEPMAGMALLTFACAGMAVWAETVPAMRHSKPRLSSVANGSCKLR